MIKMIQDKRMFFIKNLKEIQKKEEKTELIEFEIITDSFFRGDCQYGPYYFATWEISPKQNGKERKLLFRVKQAESFQFSEGGLYRGKGIIVDELISLASLFYRKRFKRGPITRVNDILKYHPLKYGTDMIDEEIIEGVGDLNELANWLDKVKGLNDKYHQKFILAVKLYHQAILNIEEQPDISYLNLISAIEVLSNDIKIDKKLSLISKNFAELINSINDEKLRKEITEAILKKEKFIKRKFVKFICDHIEDNFWKSETNIFSTVTNLEDLKKFLNNIYEQRSKTLHGGVPFPRYVFFHPLKKSEIIIPGPSYRKKREWKKIIPYPHFFERLVNHVLKNFLKRNQKSCEY